jgi:hypothetical protein
MFRFIPESGHPYARPGARSLCPECPQSGHDTSPDVAVNDFKFLMSIAAANRQRKEPFRQSCVGAFRAQLLVAFAMVASTSSTLNLAGFWRGGCSLKLSKKFRTIA